MTVNLITSAVSLRTLTLVLHLNRTATFMRPSTPKILLAPKVQPTLKAPPPPPLLERIPQIEPQTASPIPPFNFALDRAWHRSVRDGEVLSLLLLKIEYCPHRKASWKFRTNEQLGQQVTRILQGHLSHREARIFRYAHRRFACILPKTNASEVKSICHLLPIPLRAIGVIPILGATAIQPTGTKADPDFLTRTTEAAIYQASHKKSLCCVLNATEPQLLAQRVYTKLSQMPNRDRVWKKLSERGPKSIEPFAKGNCVATLARSGKTR